MVLSPRRHLLRTIQQPPFVGLVIVPQYRGGMALLMHHPCHWVGFPRLRQQCGLAVGFAVVFHPLDGVFERFVRAVFRLQSATSAVRRMMVVFCAGYSSALPAAAVAANAPQIMPAISAAK